MVCYYFYFSFGFYSPVLRIPFDRALEFANKEKITDLLYPLFVHNIGGLLYHPANQSRTNMVVQESQQRRLEGPATGPQRTPSGPQSLHHHHAMHTPISSHMSQPPSMGGRAGLDRANTFPTPPASASSLLHGSSYEWGQGMSSGVPHTQPLSIDTTLSNQRTSMPTTPATTPPGNNLQGIQSYQGQSGYDNSKPYYSAPPQSHSQYAPHTPLTQQGLSAYAQPLSTAYLKNDMAPPSARGSGTSEPETADVKPDRYQLNNGSEETVQEQESEYLPDNGAAYNANRGSYTYTTNPSVGSLTGENPQLTPEMTGSPSQQNGSGRMTPRTSGGPHSHWASGYSTPPRPSAASSLYNIVSDTRGTPANGTSADPYSVASTSTPVYSSTMNRSMGSNKRMREDNDLVRPESGADYDNKRRKTLNDATIGGPVGGATLLQPMKMGGVMARHR